MKKVKTLSIVMAALFAINGEIVPTVSAVNSTTEMDRQIQKHLLQTVFFRPNSVGVLKNFLKVVQEKDIPMSFRTPEFLNLLNKNNIEIETDTRDVSQAEENPEKEQSLQPDIKEIIEEDNLNLFKKRFEKNNNIIVEDSFFEVENMKIPILHYCVMKKAIKCFKFLILNGANPFLKLSYSIESDGDSIPGDKYQWDCMSVATCFGEWEMIKILEYVRITKPIDSNDWEAAALAHQNQALKNLILNRSILNQSQFKECLNKAIFGAVKGNNLEGLRLLLKKGANINAKDEKDNTLLHLAAKNNAVQVAKFLIDNGADIEARDNKYYSTPLCFAAEQGNLEIIKLLILKEAELCRNELIKKDPQIIQSNAKLFEQRKPKKSWRQDPANVEEDQTSIKSKIREIDPNSALINFLFDENNQFDNMSDSQKVLLRKILSKVDQIKQDQTCWNNLRIIFNEPMFIQGNFMHRNKAGEIIESAAGLLDDFFDKNKDFEIKSNWIMNFFAQKFHNGILNTKPDSLDKQLDCFSLDWDNIDKMTQLRNFFAEISEFRYKVTLAKIIGLQMEDLSAETWQEIASLDFDRQGLIDALYDFLSCCHSQESTFTKM